jgi:hypothetical protein
MTLDDPTLQKILSELAPDEHLGVILLAQVGATPQEIQVILQTTQYDSEKDGLKVIGQYVIRCIGTVEQRLSLGLFNHIAFSTHNPLLHRYNEKTVQVYFRGQPAQIDSLMLDLHQAYEETYSTYRHLVDEVNRRRPLGSLLSEGYGMLGEMALPFAQKVKSLLARHQMTTHFLEVEDDHDHHHEHDHDHGPFPRVHSHDLQYQLLVLDDSYIIAQMFSADPMGITRKGGKTEG